MSVRHAIKGFETHMHDTAAEARICTRLGGPVNYFAELDRMAPRLTRQPACRWCDDPNTDQWSPTLCRAHQAEWEGLTVDQLDRRDADQYAEWVDTLG